MTTTTGARVYAYLRASTNEQDATRAREALYSFAADHNLSIAAEFTENKSGASLERPELMRLLNIAQKGDVILIEQVDRLSRLNAEDWEKLKGIITAKGLKVVSLDLPTSHILASRDSNEFTESMFRAINGMMLDMLAAVARKDYTDRRRRAAEGVAKAKSEGKYKGRPANEQLHADIVRMVRAGTTQREVARLLKCSLGTVVNALRKDKQ